MSVMLTYKNVLLNLWKLGCSGIQRRLPLLMKEQPGHRPPARFDVPFECLAAAEQSIRRGEHPSYTG